MRFLKTKASFALMAVTACLGAGTVQAHAESIFSTTAVAGFSLSMDNIVNAGEDQIPVDPEKTAEQQQDPLAAGATEVKTVDEKDIPSTEDQEKAKKEEAEEEKEASKYDGIVLAKVNNYLNVRKHPTEEAKVVGKLYKGAAGTILKQKNGWTKIESGEVTGWVKDEFLVTGEGVETYANKVCKKVATVTVQTLRVREKATQKAKILTLVPEGEDYKVLKEGKNWVAIKVDQDVKGYVSKEYVDIDFQFDDAVSREEEKKAEEAAARELERQAEEQRQQQEAAAESASSTSNTSNTSSTSNSSSTSSSSSSSSSNSSSGSSSSSDKSYSSAGSTTRQNIVNFAVQFVGNPYVYGGTSLTNGTDCSGFTQSVYRNFGISISRTSREQATNGRSVSLSDVQPGDLIFYKNGSSIGHVALYIGNGQVVHASSPESGIKISNMYYRTPYCARSIVG